MVKRICGIYKITSPTGKVYIGQSFSIKARWFNHKRKNSGTKVSNSINKYGWDNHEKEIIHLLPKDVSVDVINNYEILYIELYKSAGIELLNTAPGGNNRIIPIVNSGKPHFNKGRKHTDATKKILAEKSRGNKNMVGIVRSQETFKKISLANTGKKASDATRKKMSEMRKGAGNARYGALVSQETRDKISAANKGNKYCLGRVLSEETKLKMSQSKKNRNLKGNGNL